MSEYEVGQIVRIIKTNKCMSDKFAYSGSYDLGDLVVVKDTSSLFFRGDEDCLGPWIYSDYAEPTGFSVGDVVEAREGTPYSITTNGWEGVIEGVFCGDITVKDLDDDLIYPVDPKFFYNKEEVRPTPETHTPETLRTFRELFDEEKVALLFQHHPSTEWINFEKTNFPDGTEKYRVVTREPPRNFGCQLLHTLKIL
jgi:hypothetical protein